MQGVLISIQPKWCEEIAHGKKTVEVRKTKPKLETPFKVYIYCTKPSKNFEWGLCGDKWGIGVTRKINYETAKRLGLEIMSGKVIGEFVCDRFTFLDAYYDINGNRHLCNTAFIKSCVPNGELFDYLYGKHGEKHGGWAWHISDLVIYEKPRELSEFYVEGDCDCMNCKNCAWFDRGNGYNVEDDCNLAYKGIELHKSFKPITRPPQSWCYVEVQE